MKTRFAMLFILDDATRFVPSNELRKSTGEIIFNFRLSMFQSMNEKKEADDFIQVYPGAKKTFSSPQNSRWSGKYELKKWRLLI